jgi:hypothetical protein
MTLWVGNLISNSPSNLFAILAKPHKNHEFTFKIRKKKMKEINKKKHKNNGNDLRHLPLH